MSDEPEGTPTPAPPGAPALRAPILAGCALTLLALVGFLLAGGAPPLAPGAPVASRIEAGWAYGWLTQLQARHPAREAGSRAHKAAPEFIASALREAGAVDVEVQRFEPGLLNVVGRVPGQDRGREVILAAHYDVVPGAPGAIDDGGAIAAILAATRALTGSPGPPPCDVVLALYDGEEQGDLGSFAHAEALGEEGRSRVQAAVAVELVGWSEDQLVVHTIPYGFAFEAEGIAPGWLPQRVRIAADEAGLSVGLGDPLLSPWYQSTIRAQRVRTGSDAGAWLTKGVPAVMLTGSALTNFYDAYHLPGDSMQQVSPERLDDAARVIAAAAVELGAVPAAAATRALGDAYFLVGLRRLPRSALTIVGLLSAATLLLASLSWLGAGQRLAFALLAACASASAGSALLADVLGLVMGVPLCLGLAAATAQQQRHLVYVARIPVYVQVLISYVAGTIFGFAWRAGPVETALAAALALSGVLGGTRLAQLLRGAPDA